MDLTPYGFLHSDICGSNRACQSPQLFAAYHVLLRLLMPRHPPCALSSLTWRRAKYAPLRPRHEPMALGEDSAPLLCPTPPIEDLSIFDGSRGTRDVRRELLHPTIQRFGPLFGSCRLYKEVLEIVVSYPRSCHALAWRLLCCLTSSSCHSVQFSRCTLRSSWDQISRSSGLGLEIRLQKPPWWA